MGDWLLMKKFFIRSSNDVIKQELEKLQNKVDLLEATYNTVGNVKGKRKKRTAVYSPATEVEAKTVEVAFEEDDEMFTTS